MGGMTRAYGMPARRGELPPTADVVVIGAGVVGAACAYYAAGAGLRVAVLDRGPVAGGTTGAGEGNLLVSDKSPGPELDLALHSLGLWHSLAAEAIFDGGRAFELEHKGGLVVAGSPGALGALRALARRQRAAGVEAVDLAASALAGHEPLLAPDLAGGVAYPQDAQVQPMLAAAHLLRAARGHGATVHNGATVTGIDIGTGGSVCGVRTGAARIATPAVVNAAGTWSGAVAALAGVDLPIRPRRGFVLVTEPLPVLIRHKVYAAEYVSNVASADSDLQTSPVIEGTRGGTVLIGSSRERVGFDATFALPVLQRLAEQAIELFPFLRGVAVIRAYRGFRPYSPDHLPVIGPDPRRPGLFHACGHEGAGIGLAPGTADLIVAALTGAVPALDPTPFRPERFTVDTGVEEARHG
jgi:glycine/D-amino acid oxidase-like deaminating enzyme